MKRRDFSLAAISAATVAGLPLVAQAQGPAALKPVEGKDYLSLDKRVPTDVGTGKIEVIEFFWYSCPHCHAFEPKFAEWVKAAPKDVVVQRVPVRFRDDFEAQQRAYYVFESLNMVDVMHGKLFHAIHTFNSFGVATKARRATQLQDAFKVQGVPALGIAGRFYTDGGLAQSMDRALQVTDYLIGEVRRGR
jgi:protein dithiol oxidoreductase (disulfide-forming)